jgi:hypothetical protein
LGCRVVGGGGGVSRQDGPNASSSCSLHPSSIDSPAFIHSPNIPRTSTHSYTGTHHPVNHRRELRQHHAPPTPIALALPPTTGPKATTAPAPAILPPDLFPPVRVLQGLIRPEEEGPVRLFGWLVGWLVCGCGEHAWVGEPVDRWMNGWMNGRTSRRHIIREPCPIIPPPPPPE